MNWKTILFLAALAVVTYALVHVLGAGEQVLKADFALAALSVFLYLASIWAWNQAWGMHLKLGAWKSNVLGFASQFGAFTPFGLGNDFLKGYFLKELGIGDLQQGASASLATKFQKIGAALVFSLIGAGFLLLSEHELGAGILVGIAAPLAFFGGIYLLGTGRGIELIARLSMDKIPRQKAHEFFQDFKKAVKNVSPGIFSLIALSLLLEFASFYAALAAFRAPLEFFGAYLLFVLLFFVEKIPLTPQGLGTTEAVGFFALTRSFDAPTTAAILLLWDVSRIWAPTIIGFAFFTARKKLLKK